MADNPFLQALKVSVGRTTAAFDKADEDLHAAIGMASEAVSQISEGRLALELDLRADGVAGRLYDVDVTDSGDTVSTVGAFFIPNTGYPIQFGEREKDNTFYSHGRLEMPEALNQHLVDLLSNPDSSLTVAVAFRMRRATRG